MLNLKKMVSALLGVTMVANMALNLPAFADEASITTYNYDDYKIEYSVATSWENSETIIITITNTGDSTIENWMLAYDDFNGEINNIWNAKIAETDSGYEYVRNVGHNANIEPNQSINFGYTLENYTGIPDILVMTQERLEKSTESYDATLNIINEWDSTFQGEIVLTNNTDQPIEWWELTFDSNFTITEVTTSWAASVVDNGNCNYTFKGTYTGIIDANSSVSLGFIGIKNGEPEIVNYSLTEVIIDEEVINSMNWFEDDIDWESMLDSDGDGLPDEYEAYYGCDPTNPDTDDDDLPDGYEILMIGSDPSVTKSIVDTLADGEYDNDEDGLNNYEEYILGTNPLISDSDYDGLSDGDEESVYGTDMLNPDTDKDDLSDSDEIALGLNPLVPDTDGDGVPDNEEMFNQNKTFDADEDDTVVQQIGVAFEGTGYIDSTTSVKSVMDVDWMCSNVVGLVGEPYDITSDSSYDTATLTFTIDQASLGDIQFDDLSVLWYNEGEQRFEEMETNRDSSNATLSITTTHFSKYLIVDCDRWYAAWEENNYPVTGNTLHTAITIDCSTSMDDNDPNCYRITAANSFVDVMTAADLASIIFFADGADEKQELTDDQEALKNAIDQVFSAGTTNYEAALRYSIDSLEKQPDTNADNIIIFLSDGRPTNIVDGVGIEIPEEEFDYSLVDEAASKGIRIYTIGLTENVNENILKEMANRTNGGYYYANTAEELISYFLTVNMGQKYDITTDTDEDGIPDLFETYGMPVANGQVVFTDPEKKDTDGDSLEDGEELIMHIVDDADEVETAYKYMYDYIPDILISSNGGIYFQMTSDPADADTDDDLDLDNADPGPTVKQLNGYFIDKMNELQLAANKYLEGTYTPSVNDDYYGKKDICLCFYFIRQFKYNSFSWSQTGGEDEAFVEYINENYLDLYNYFKNTTYINADYNGHKVELKHYAANVNAQLYSSKGLVILFFSDTNLNHYAGWAGDLQQVVSEAYNDTYSNNKYTNLYEAMTAYLTKNGKGFGPIDFYSDMDSLNISKLLLSSNDSVKEWLEIYYDENNIQNHGIDFVANVPLTQSLIEYFLTTETYYLENGSNKMSPEDVGKCILAFKEYVLNEIGVVIDE